MHLFVRFDYKFRGGVFWKLSKKGYSTTPSLYLEIDLDA